MILSLFIAISYRVCNLLETSVEGLEEVATSFLLAVEAKMKQRQSESSA